MAVTSGFFNSLNGDRKYNANQMGAMFEGLINDGVYLNIGETLKVTPNSGMKVNVGIGRAWFQNTWLSNDSILPLTIADADLLLNRIDAVVLEFNADDSVRQNTIKVLKGDSASSPVRPKLIKSEKINQYPLAYVRVNKGATSISKEDITDMVGSAETPYVTGILQKSGTFAMSDTKISAGTGLSGGGDLSKDRTISANFGTGSTQVARGNHTHSGYMTDNTGAGSLKGTANNGSYKYINLGGRFNFLIMYVNGGVALLDYKKELALLWGPYNNGAYLGTVPFKFPNSGRYNAELTSILASKVKVTFFEDDLSYNIQWFKW